MTSFKPFILRIITCSLLIFSCCFLLSCSDEDGYEGKNDKIALKEVKFNISAGDITPETRATDIINSSNYNSKINSFKVWGSFDSEDENSLNGAEITNNNGVCSWKNSNEKIFWPNTETSLSVAAVTPVMDSQYINVSDGKSDPTATFFVPVDVNEQKDYMAAINGNVEYNKVATLNFEHLLSQLNVKVRVDDNKTFGEMMPDYNLVEIFIKSITIHNLMSKVNYSLSGASNLRSNPLSNSYLDYKFDIGNPDYIKITSSAKGFTQVSNTDNVLLAVPQKLQHWTENTTRTQADNNHQCYIELECVFSVIKEVYDVITRKPTEAGADIIGTSDIKNRRVVPLTWGKTYLDLHTLTLERGKSYTLYITVSGAGRDDDGNQETSSAKCNIVPTAWISEDN